LGEKIKSKTCYQAAVNTEKLIADVVDGLDREKMEPPRIVASKVGVTVHAQKDELDYQLFGQGVLAKLAAHHGPPNIVQVWRISSPTSRRRSS